MANENIDAELRARIPIVSEAVRNRIEEIDEGRKAGWILEYQHEPVALLNNCQFYDMFWDSYDITYLTEDQTVLSILQDRNFWYKHDNSSDVVIRNQEFPEFFPLYHIINFHEDDPNKIVARGLYICLDPLPDKPQTADPKSRFLSWLGSDIVLFPLTIALTTIGYFLFHNP